MARARFRSVRFDLEAAVALATIVGHAGGTIAPDLLAAGLGYSGTNNGTYLTRLANARLFGLVAGRGNRIEITERARLILAAAEPSASEARRRAFLAVPLFRAVVEAQGSSGTLPGRAALADLLVHDFAVADDKALVLAAKLLDSARQAGMGVAGHDGNLLLRGHAPILTTVDNSLPTPAGGRVVKFRRAQGGGRHHPTAGERGDEMTDDRLWLDEGSDEKTGAGGRASIWRRTGVVAAAVAVVAVVAVPVGVALTGSPTQPTAQAHKHGKADTSKTLGSGPAEHQVLNALSATTDAGNFDFTYTLSTTAATEPTTTATQPGAGEANASTPVAGAGIDDTNPQGMLVNATLGNGGLQVSLRVDSTTLYEDLSSLETGLAPPANQAGDTGQQISSFAGITESTIGNREGAIAMLGLASPTGYLDLYQQDIEGAAQGGTTSVDGDPVTTYQVAVDPNQLADEPNATSEEIATETAAVSVLQGAGYTGTTDAISVDASGFIREVDSVAHFSDGGTVVLDITLTSIGCAGTVLMPGQSGPTQPPSDCTSPDTGQASSSSSASTSSASTTTPAPTTTTSTTTEVPSTPSTTVGAAPSTTSTDPNATSTTTPVS
ncbi:MAG: hypothetical protein ACRDY1_03835 [Acidimicrobiales bacterium]